MQQPSRRLVLQLGSNDATSKCEESVQVAGAYEVQLTSQRTSCAILSSQHGSSVKHLGTAQLRLESKTGKSSRGSFELSGVGKTSLSAVRMVDPGYEVVFSGTSRFVSPWEGSLPLNRVRVSFRLQTRHLRNQASCADGQVSAPSQWVHHPLDVQPQKKKRALPHLTTLVSCLCASKI